MIFDNARTKGRTYVLGARPKGRAYVLLLGALVLGASAVAMAATPLAGTWDATVVVNKVDIPFRFEIAGDGASVRGWFFDGDLKMSSTRGRVEPDGTLVLEFSQLGTTLTATPKDGQLEGSYSRGTRGAPYPFRAARAVAVRPPAGKVPSIEGEWKIPVKSSKGEEAWRFIVRQSGPQVSATILRVDGDTGTLSGSFKDGKFVISHFSGARPALYIVTPLQDGTLELAQNNGANKMVAVRVNDARAKEIPEPTDPALFTRVKDPNERFHFSFPDLDGKLVSDGDARFAGKVVLVSISGSWCPNCHDEAPFLAELYKKYRGKGLEIVGLSFEEADQMKNPTRVRGFVAQYGIEYPMLLCGSPDQASERLPQAVNLNSFPTTFMLGRDGKVKSVHAGFASKASGKFHEENKRLITAEVERLLAARPQGTR